VAWDVKARPETGSDNRFVTFSERVGSADMHTDSSFYPMPEQQFILYVVNAAQCDGGHSILIDADDIYHGLHRTPEGATAFALLSSTPVPFRVPPATRPATAGNP
jgi:alpha-ketoglutarate-dependent taurine dioxygenase